MRSWKQRLAIFVIIFAVLYVAACVYIRVMEVELTFLPMKDIQTDPARMGMRFEEVNIPVGNGEEQGNLNGFWVPADVPDAPAFLYLHGRNATIGKNLEHTKRLHQLGYNVLLIDYRGFGKSVGTTGPTEPSENKVYEDAEAAWKHLTTERGFKPQQAFIYGHSLGGAIAIELAKQHPEAAGLITESAFTSILAMSKTKLKFNGMLRYLPMNLLITQRLDSLSKIQDVKIPVLFIHGTWDPKIPHTMSMDLHKKATHPNKVLLLIDRGEHTNCGSVDWVKYKKTVTTFVQRCLGQAAPLTAPITPQQTGATPSDRRLSSPDCPE